MTTDTIPGGAYKLPDGTWVNANGKRIPAPKELPDMFADAPEVQEPELPVAGLDEFAKPEDLVTDTPADKPKIRRKTKEG